MSNVDSKRPTPSRVRKLLSYDKDTGLLTWLQDVSNCAAGDVAGAPDRGYIRIGLDGSDYRAHVLAFVIVKGRWPASDIDHKNGIKHDNRWANLREVTHSVNMQNRQRANTNSSTGVIGVSIEGRRYRASATIKGKAVNLGRFDTIEEAAAARKAAVDEHYSRPHKSQDHAFEQTQAVIQAGITAAPFFAI